MCSAGWTDGTMKVIDPNVVARSFGTLFCVLALLPVIHACAAAGPESTTGGQPVFGLDCDNTPERPSTCGQPGFTFDCDNTPENPCRKLVARDRDKPIVIESSSAAWTDRYKKVIVVSDNYNDLVEHQAAHYVIAFFELEGAGAEIEVHPLLTPKQAEEFRLFDLEGVTLDGDRLYAIGSLALHGKDPRRDRWERHQFVQMDLVESKNGLSVANLSHVAKRWPNFRDWVLSKSGHEWTGEETRGRAEGTGINVEALSITGSGNLLIGFRGPQSAQGGALALEIKLPRSVDEEPELVKRHLIPPVDVSHIPKGAAKTLRAISKIPGQPGEYYVLLGPIGYEKEAIVLAHWNSDTGQLTKATQLPKGFVGEGVSPMPGDRVLVVDDLKGMILVATEN
jgi:hypothetical protein